MCGILGVALKADNGFTKKTEDSFYEMLYVGTVRGDDSTGVIYVENDASFGYMKDATAATWCSYAMQNDPSVKGMWSRGKALIGHNRKKTIGAVSDETAHPFVVGGKFAMVHNGTLYNHKQLADTVVDSEALTIHLSKVLNKDYTKEKLEAALGQVNGAYAIAAFDMDSNKVYLTRNKDRPLSIIETDDGWFWASEGNMLYWVLGRNGIDWKKARVQSIRENCLVTIDLDKNTMTMEDYVPKKATPQAPIRVVGATSQVNTKTLTSNLGKLTPSGTRISKNEFKRIKKRFMQADLLMYAEDYLEKAFPKTIAEGEVDVILLGVSEVFNFEHTIQAEFDINDIVPGINALTDCYYAGKIADMTYETSRGYVTITLSNLRMIPPSIKKLQYETPTDTLALH